MWYEWDEAKRQVNLIKHGVDFSDIYLFDWDTATTISSDRNGETRFASIGYIGERLLLVVYTIRGASIRIISMRDPSHRERERHERLY